MASAEQSSKIAVALTHEEVVRNYDADDIGKEDLIGSEIGREGERSFGEIPRVDGKWNNHTDDSATAVVYESDMRQLVIC